MNKYKPLPKGLRIEKSKIEGYGLITLAFIKVGTNLGTSHIKIEGELIRTPLGGFINHSDEPNCEKVELKSTNYTKYNLVAIKNIKAWEELTVKYTFYNMSTPITAPMMDLE